MKPFIFILLLLLVKPSDDNKHLLSCHLSNIPFTEFTSIIYQQTGIRVFFDEVFVKDIKVTIDADSISVESALKIALKETGIKVSAWHNNYILLPNENLITQLPDYKQKTANKDTINIYSKKLTNSESRYITTRTSNGLQRIRVGKNGSSFTSKGVVVNGRIADNESGVPLVDASIFIEENGKGAITDNNGLFTLTLLPGIYNAKIQSIGYEKKKLVLEIYSDGDFFIELKKVDILIDEVLVYGDRQTNLRTKDPGLEKIAAKTVKEIPMMIGERDIIKVSSLLPGIVSVGEGSAGLNVRGGSSDQNAFYINKIPIYNTSHLFGFFPAFNSDIIKDFSIYKGYVPAEYGGRLSSIFNITTRQANRKRFTAHGGVNPVTGYITVEGPILKDFATLMVSARSSYSDWILSKIKDPTIRESSAIFNDFTGSLSFDKKNSQLSLFVYNSNDKFRLSNINEYQYSNLGGSVNLKHSFNSNIKGEFTVVGSEYSFATNDNQEISIAYKHNYKIGDYEFHGDIKHLVNDKITLDYGASINLYKLNRGLVLPFGESSLRIPVNLGKEQGVESAIYLTNKYNILPKLSLSLGLRQSLYNPIGSKSVYSYKEGFSREEKNIIDTTYFSSNKIIKWYFSPEIRSTINYQTDKDGSIKLAFNKMQQNLFMLSNTIALAPNTQWKLADYHIKPSKSIQVSIGVFRNIPQLGLETSVELYVKKIKNYPEFKDGVNFLSGSPIETSLLQGGQKAYGVEFFVKRSFRKLEGWLSYTYSRSIVRINGKNSWEKINEGNSYPSNHDIPHALNALINYHFNRRVTFSTITTYQSGRPITYPQSLYYLNGVQHIDYSYRNKYSIPYYFRIDASLTIEGNLKRNKFIHSSLMFSVFNLTGRKNPYSIYFKSENGLVKCYKYSVIGIPLFTITWLLKLGNYASD